MKYGLSAPSAIHYVVEGIFIFYSGWARHVGSIVKLIRLYNMIDPLLLLLLIMNGNVNEDIRYSLATKNQDDSKRKRYVRKNAWPNVWAMNKFETK